ncbi:hypothetical protein SDJN02_08420, partial [Cucurbita argyrosperma subsp. argyrosperma]
MPRNCLWMKASETSSVNPILTTAVQHLSHVIQARKESKLKVEKKDYNEVDMAKIQKMKEEEKTLREFRAKAQQKGTFGDARLKKSGKK